MAAPGPKRKQYKETLNAKERLFVANFKGNRTEAARLAGYSSPNVNGTRVYARPRVRKAIEQKDTAFLNKIGQEEARGVTINRNDIINGLAEIAQNKTITPAARVGAYGHLKDIFGLSAKNDKDTDIFAGWSKEELDEYGRTGKLPARFGPGALPSEGETSSFEPSGN